MYKSGQPCMPRAACKQHGVSNDMHAVVMYMPEELTETLSPLRWLGFLKVWLCSAAVNVPATDPTRSSMHASVQNNL